MGAEIGYKSVLEVFLEAGYPEKARNAEVSPDPESGGLRSSGGSNTSVLQGHLSVTFRTPMDPRCLLRVDDAVHLASTCIRPYVRPPAPGDRLSWEARGPGY